MLLHQMLRRVTIETDLQPMNQICHVVRQKDETFTELTLRVLVILDELHDSVFLEMNSIYLLMSLKSKQLQSHPLLHSAGSISQSLKIMSHTKTLRVQTLVQFGKLKSIEVFE